MTDGRFEFDAVVVGSGFGGSVSAYRLAKAGLYVCVLERGKAYPPRSFARDPRDMGNNVWDPASGRHGLFNFFSFRKLETVVASGLGGGSLIYANVLLRMPQDWFTITDPDGGRPRPWPVTYDDLEPHYASVEEVLAPKLYPYLATTPKTREFHAAAKSSGGTVELPPLAITFADNGQEPQPGVPITESGNLHGRQGGRLTCCLCGECDIGCNYGSKNTLDFNYLTMAQNEGAELRTRCEVRSIKPHGNGYRIDYVEHRKESEGSPTDTSRLPLETVTAERLVLAAGSLGSTLLLLKNRANFPRISDRLGTRFSGNGDFLALASGTSQPVNPSYGPVITSAVRGPDFYIQEGGFPGAVHWLLQVNPRVLGRLVRFVLRRTRARLTGDPQSDLGEELSRIVGRQRSAHTLPMLGMGRDVPDGTMRLRRGHLDIDWTTRSSMRYFRRLLDQMDGLSAALGGQLRPNPLWQLRRVVTAHPLGGCPMGEHPREGVVDCYGQVFNYPGLFIADGSVVPGPTGANPALTIAALADRFAERMIEPVEAR